MIEITTKVGRLVSGHPMMALADKNDDGTPKMQKDGITPSISFYGGLAIVKGTESHWNQTEWGAAIWNEGLAAFPNGETQNPTFAWKIEDGDSQIPNKKGKIPNQREGWPGHWIMHISNGFPFDCYRDGNFNPFEAIQNKDEIKTGDYCQYILEVKGNNISGRKKTDGVYINPKAFNLVRAGQKIISASTVDALAGFGGSDRTLPSNALVDQSVAAPPPNTAAAPPANTGPGNTVAAPANDFVAGAGAAPPPPAQQPAAPAPPAQEQIVNVGGTIYTVSALKSAGWTQEQIQQKIDQSFDDDIPF